jgi:hypothetical protein
MLFLNVSAGVVEADMLLAPNSAPELEPFNQTVLK